MERVRAVAPIFLSAEPKDFGWWGGETRPYETGLAEIDAFSLALMRYYHPDFTPEL